MDGIKEWCRHFTGVQHETCEAGVDYMSVRDTTGPGMAKWPCTRANQGVAITCPLFEAYSKSELDEHDRRLAEAIGAITDLESRKSDICPHCGKQITSMRQVGRCVYASCGCRLWQGRVPAAWKS